MGAIQLRVGCEFRYDVAAPTPGVLQIQPRSDGPHTVLRQRWSGDPELARHSYRDTFGNTSTRVTFPVGPLTLRYDALVETSDRPEDTGLDVPETPVADLPDGVLVYTLPSRFCVSDVLADEAWSRFGTAKPGWRRVQEICDAVNAHLRFGYGSSGPTTTAADAYAAGQGVCRDFAHVAISFCRALNIPARYVFGYLPDVGVEPTDAPMDFAAWFEAWLDGRWWTFDPRNNTTRVGRVVIGKGRDAVDVAMVTSYGGPALEGMTVWADEVRDG